MHTWQKALLQCKHYLTAISCCEICEQPLSEGQSICHHCLSILPRFKLEKFRGDLLNRPEFHKLFKPLEFQHLIAFGPYQYPTKQWLTNYKYRRQLRYQQLCNQLLVHQLTQLKSIEEAKPIDLIIPMPIHTSKWLRRGFNQCHGLAEAVADYFGLSVSYQIICRVKKGAAQAGRSGAERRKALKGHFTLVNSASIANKHIWLVDDIVTTGSTANEVSRLLIASGAASVTLVTLAISL